MVGNLINIGLEVGQSDIHGWGVFADKDLQKKSTIIQCACVIITTGEYCPTSLLPYSFSMLGDLFIPIGIAGLINSSPTPNCIAEYDKDNKILSIQTTKDVMALEEITLKYM
jgi:SET domain-containing protein